MRRALAFVQYKARWWRQLATQQIHNDEALREGCYSYALKQAALQEALASAWLKKWSPILVHARKSPAWDKRVDLGVQLSSENDVIVLELGGDDDGDDDLLRARLGDDT
jgi:hypothetical protein